MNEEQLTLPPETMLRLRQLAANRTSTLSHIANVLIEEALYYRDLLDKGEL